MAITDTSKSMYPSVKQNLKKTTNCLKHSHYNNIKRLIEMESLESQDHKADNKIRYSMSK